MQDRTSGTPSPPIAPLNAAATPIVTEGDSYNDDSEEYVYDVYYRSLPSAVIPSATSTAAASHFPDAGLHEDINARIGELTGLTSEDEAMLMDPEYRASTLTAQSGVLDSDDEEGDEEDQDSNEEDFYRNDYPEDEDAEGIIEADGIGPGSGSEAESSDSEHQSDSSYGSE